MDPGRWESWLERGESKRHNAAERALLDGGHDNAELRIERDVLIRSSGGTIPPEPSGSATRLAVRGGGDFPISLTYTRSRLHRHGLPKRPAPVPRRDVTLQVPQQSPSRRASRYKTVVERRSARSFAESEGMQSVDSSGSCRHWYWASGFWPSGVLDTGRPHPVGACFEPWR